MNSQQCGVSESHLVTSHIMMMLTPHGDTSLNVTIKPTKSIVLAGDWLKNESVTQFWPMT